MTAALSLTVWWRSDRWQLNSMATPCIHTLHTSAESVHYCEWHVVTVYSLCLAL